MYLVSVLVCYRPTYARETIIDSDAAGVGGSDGLLSSGHPHNRYHMRIILINGLIYKSINLQDLPFPEQVV